jgi:hypothetical protein
MSVGLAKKVVPLLLILADREWWKLVAEVWIDSE